MKLFTTKKTNQRNRSRIRPKSPGSSKASNTYSTHNQPRRSPISGDTRTRNSVGGGAPASGPKYPWRWLPLTVIGVVIIGLLLYTSFVDVSNPKVRIIAPNQAETFTVVKDDILRENAYMEATAAALRESILSRSKFTVNKSRIESALIAEFPEIQLASLQFHLIDKTPIIRLVPRNPVLLVESTQDNTRYYVDANGVVMAQKSTNTSEDSPLRTVVDESGLELIPGSRVLPVDTIRFIDQVEEQFNAADLRIQSMSLPAVANELHVRVVGDEFVGKFDITADVRIQAGTFIAVREQLNQDNIQPREYIDARIQGRAYYR